MRDVLQALLLSAAFFAVFYPLSLVERKARRDGRGKWLGYVGRNPRDLFVDRRVRSFANVTEEWLWLGFVVSFVGIVMLLFDTTASYGSYVSWVGFAMMTIRFFGKPVCVAFGQLSPQYESGTTAIAKVTAGAR